MPDINSDIVPNSGERIPQPGDVTSVTMPQSAVPQSQFNDSNPTPSVFDQDPEEKDELFVDDESKEQQSYRNPIRATDRPVASSIIALALSDPSMTNDLTLLSDSNLNAARELLDNQQEYNARLQIAAGRQIDTMKYVDNLRQQWEDRAKTTTVPKEVTNLINTTYNNVMSRDREEDANTAAEFEAIDRIRGYMTQNDPQEAYLAQAAFFGSGTAEKTIADEATKSLIMLQRQEELEAEYQNSSWIRGFFNGVIRMVPFADAFSASGILDDAGVENDAGGILDFILRGKNLTDQREALFDLPTDKFAKAMAPNGPVMNAIRRNADWLMADPARANEVGSILLSKNQPDTLNENLFGVADVAMLAAAGSGKLTNLLKGLGVRSAAVDQTTKAMLETLGKGVQEAKSATGLGMDEVTENITPSMFMPQKGVSLGPDVAAHLKTAQDLRDMFPTILATHQMQSADDIKAAFEVYQKSLLEGGNGSYIKDIKFVEENIASGASKEFAGQVAEDGATVYKLQVIAGKKTGGGYAKEASAQGLLEKFGREGEVIKDPETGQYFAKMEVSVPIDGFITSDLKTPNAVLAPLRSSARTADRVAVDKGILAGNSANRFLKQAEALLKASVKPIGRKERKTLTEIIKKGQNEEKWYNPEEFSILYEREHGKPPTPEVHQAYETYRAVNDLAYLLRNDSVYIRKFNQGFESHEFRMAGRDVDVDAVEITDPKRRPLGHKMWDASNDRWLADNISSEEVQKMADEGYSMLRLDEPFELPDGRRADYVMVKKGDLKSRPLRRMQLNYSQGGSRAYNATHFIKQAMEDIDGNLITPKTYIAGRDLNEMKAWSIDMNKALDLYRSGETDPMKFDDIFTNRPGYPSGEEFLDMIHQREISTKHNFEVVEDTKMPSAYFNKDPQALRFVDMDETALDSYYRSSGKMYYGTKGEHLKDTTGDFAETIDPWNTLNSTITEASRAYTFSGYKQNMLERFKKTYGAYLDLDNVRQMDSLYGLAKAPIKSSAPRELTFRIKNEQSAIARLMNFETEYEKTIRERWRSAADWILGSGSKDSLRAKGRDAMYWLQKNNPVQFVRTLAFDANLGFFNVGQLFVQTSTIASAMALHGEKSLKALRLLYPMKAFALSGYKENVLDALAKKGIWKGAFESEDEFKLFARTLRDSGLYEVSGHNLAMIREFGANKIFGASSTYDAVSEKGRMFFYAAEQFNRTVAARIAWDDLKAMGLKPGTARFRERFAGLTDDYSFNMMSQSSAAFQHGLPSIPTQFWAYGFRMMDALMGRRFTAAQKVRLLLANATMAGAAGVPGGALVKELYQRYTGKPITMDDADGWVARGLFDGLAHVITGADVEIGSKVGTADQMQNIFQDLFGVGDYGEKSVYDMIMGASGAKVASTVPALWDVVKWNAAEVSGDTGGLDKDAWFRLGQEVSSVRGVLNSFMAARYAAYWSKNGTLVANDLPTADEFFFALGFQPGQQSEMSFYFDAGKDEAIDEAAKKLTQLRQDAFTIPDKYEENRKKAQALMLLFTPSERLEIRKKAFKAMDQSMLKTLAKRYQKEQVESEFYDSITPMINEDEGNTNGQ